MTPTQIYRCFLSGVAGFVLGIAGLVWLVTP